MTAGPSVQLLVGDLGGAGLNSGFLGRVTVLEREIKFLKAKVEEDSRWKTILEEWILSNFAFDLRGALLKRTQPDLFPNSQATLQKPKLKKKEAKNNESNNSKGSRSEQVAGRRGGRGGRRGAVGASPLKRGRKRKNQYEEEDETEEDEVEEEEEAIFDSNGDEDFSDFELDPRDLIITPDINEVKSSSGSNVKNFMKTERISPQLDESDFEGFAIVLNEDKCKEAQPTQPIVDESNAKAENESKSSNKGNKTKKKRKKKKKKNNKGEDDKNSGSESSSEEDSEEFKNSYPRKKMDWYLMSTYPNYDAMLKSFPLQRDWAIHTTCTVAGKIKKYYYCKMCSKKGPIRLQVIYENTNEEVEILQNNHSHDHDFSKRRFLCEEMKSEIFTLYRAGLRNSTQIIDAIKTSKPDLKVPTAKQVTFLLKSTRKQDVKTARRLKKQQSEETTQKAELNSLPDSQTLPSGIDHLSHPQLPPQSYLSTPGIQMRTMQITTASSHLTGNNSYSSSGYAQQSQPALSATPISTHTVSTNQFTYDQALLQFSHHHQSHQ